MVNLFILSLNLHKSARYTVKCHLSRGIFEAVKSFYSARKLLNVTELYPAYNASHLYHGIVLWITHSYLNYVFLYKFTKFLNQEYKIRYKKDKDHASFIIMKRAYESDIDEIYYYFSSYDNTWPYQAMPYTFRLSCNNYVDAYRRYYFFHKRYSLPFIDWGEYMNIPYWYNDEYFINKGIYYPVL